MKIFKLLMIPITIVFVSILTSLSQGNQVACLAFAVFFIAALITCSIIKARICMYMMLVYWVFMTFLSFVFVYSQFTYLEGRLASLPFSMLAPITIFESELVSSVVAAAISIVFFIMVCICLFLGKKKAKD